jgi:hypothetical protein
MRLPAMITAITAEVGRRGRSRTAVCVSNTGSYPGPRLADHIARSANHRTGLSTRARDDSAAAVDSIPPGAGLPVSGRDALKMSLLALTERTSKADP